MSCGHYSVDGGFWSVLTAVQTSGGPLLTITLTATNNAVVSWPYPSTGFVLQQNPDLSSSDWTDVVLLPTMNTATLQYELWLPAGGRMFYRLVSK